MSQPILTKEHSIPVPFPLARVPADLDDRVIRVYTPLETIGQAELQRFMRGYDRIEDADPAKDREIVQRMVIEFLIDSHFQRLPDGLHAQLVANPAAQDEESGALQNPVQDVDHRFPEGHWDERVFYFENNGHSLHVRNDGETGQGLSISRIYHVDNKRAGQFVICHPMTGGSLVTQPQRFYEAVHLYLGHLIGGQDKRPLSFMPVYAADTFNKIATTGNGQTFLYHALRDPGVAAIVLSSTLPEIASYGAPLRDRVRESVREAPSTV
ncbi:MAG: hypothetical protein V1735_06510 [Nanoarchaeota archaeon]